MPKFRIVNKNAVLDRKGAEMNARALEILNEERAKQQAKAGVVIRQMPDGSVWTQNPERLFKVEGIGETKHQRLLREAIARKNARELAEKTRLIPTGRKVDKREVAEVKTSGQSQRDTSVLGTNKMFGTQGRWD